MPGSGATDSVLLHAEADMSECLMQAVGAALASIRAARNAR